MRTRNVIGGLVATLCASWAATATTDECLRSVGRVPLGGEIRAVAADGEHAFAAASEGDVLVVHVAGPGEPRIVATIQTPGHPVGLEIAGNRLYVVEYDFGLHVVDVSDPRQPTIVGSAATACAAQALAVTGDRAFVACFRAGLEVFDVSRPERPRSIGAHDTPGLAYGVAVDDGVAYVADFTSGLRILDVSRPSRIREVGAVPGLRRAVDVVVGGGFAYVADAQEGLSVVDVSRPDAPEEVGLISISSGVTDLHQNLGLDGDRLYVARDRLWVVDVTNPVAPRIATDAELPEPTSDLTVERRVAYVSTRASGVLIFDHAECGGGGIADLSSAAAAR